MSCFYTLINSSHTLAYLYISETRAGRVEKNAKFHIRSKRATCALGMLDVRPVRVAARHLKSVRVSCAFEHKTYFSCLQII